MGPPDTLTGPRKNEDEEVEFDSQDEDECEDLFAGVWSASLAAKRRKARGFQVSGKGNSSAGSWSTSGC